MTALAMSSLSKAEARSLTDEVKHDAERLWRKLVELYDGKAHLALGYSSWGSYFKSEFGGSRSRAYQLLDAGRALEIVSQSTTVDSLPRNEAQARELAPLLSEPDRLRDAWREASANGAPTALAVREAVATRIAVPLDDDLLARQQRQTLIDNLDRCVRGMELSASHARAEAARLLRDGDGDPGPFTPSRFERAAEFAIAFANALREAGIDG